MIIGRQMHRSYGHRYNYKTTNVKPWLQIIEHSKHN